jgi:hypothetical protein
MIRLKGARGRGEKKGGWDRLLAYLDDIRLFELVCLFQDPSTPF